ncbi:MAG: TIGR01212 family radical SAM protein [Ruminococcaceae bacterium]|nr:TIGR01212 family radical SAM protein [Oscillospiraceae bacterium]
MSPYYGVNEYFKDRFGCKVYKLALDGGFTCPNRDGTLGNGGCIFCLEGSGAFAERSCQNLDVQIKRAKQRLASKADTSTKYIAYFQAYTNTYAPVERLRELYLPLTERDDIVAISIATRPDCLSEDVLDFLVELNRKKPLFLELGLQTIHERTADYIRRGYNLECYNSSAEELNRRGIELVTHIILGLPFETEEMMLESVAHACKYSKGIKLQLLHVLEGTDLAEDYKQGKFKTLELDEYVKLVKKCVDIIPKDVVIHRLTGDGAKRHLIAPLWSGDKKRVINSINSILRQKR